MEPTTDQLLEVIDLMQDEQYPMSFTQALGQVLNGDYWMQSDIDVTCLKAGDLINIQNRIKNDCITLEVYSVD